MRTTIVLTALLAAAPSQAKPPAVEPRATAALERMGAFLREQQSFTVRMTTETDYVLDTGQKVRLAATGDVRVRRPDRVRADVESERKDRQYYYDGTSFTIYGPKVGYYATVSAPPTILQTADMLQTRYGLELPMVDLFRWGSEESDFDEITSATYIGEARIDGVDTDHYAFRQPGLDWQIWIKRGEQPVPKKLVLTTTDDPARPERDIELSWELGVRHPDSDFAFTPPKDSQQIKLVEISEENHAPVTSQRDRAARRAREHRQ